MAVPKAPVNENGRSEAGQDDIWSTGQISAMQQEAQSVSMEASTHGEFGRGILSANPLHMRRAGILELNGWHDGT